MIQLKNYVGNVKISKLTRRNNDVLHKWYLSHSHNMRDTLYHRQQMHRLTLIKRFQSHTLATQNVSDIDTGN